MGLKTAEGFLDAVAITDSGGTTLQTGLAPACTVYKLSDGSSTALTVAEVGATGIYKVTDWTTGAATEYFTVWSVAGAYDIHGPYKLFKVGGGQEDDIQTDITTILTDTNELQGDWTNGGRLDLLIDAIKAKTDNLPADPSDASDINDIIKYLTNNAISGAVTGSIADQVRYLDSVALGTPTSGSIGHWIKSVLYPYTAYIHNQAISSPTSGSVADQVQYMEKVAIATPTANSLCDRMKQNMVKQIWWSNVQPTATITGGSTDVSLPSVTVPALISPSTATIKWAYCGLKFRSITDTSGAANAVNGAADVQVRDDAPGVWADCIVIPDNVWAADSSVAPREPGDVVLGNVDVKSAGKVDAFDDTYEFQLDDVQADAANLVLNDVQTFIILYYQ